MQKAIVLASTSRYRREIVERLGLPIHCAAPVCDETPLAGESALETAVRLARIKAMSLADAYPDALIIGGDQVALLDGQQIGKPGSFENGVAMLQWMSGRTVVFHSALALYNSKSGRLQENVGLTRVTLRQLSESQIRTYLSREPDALHCAGAAKSEGLGGALLQSVESDDPNSLIGVPLFALISMLINEDIDIL
ncbi:Maf family nucleotide pyrophosphatase [Craterilacuibacter sinensis]|uniref:7-methyl-GTP pyrophosphatase n=1 Tax=Craterilacuibacter sinensis TaxID=2686017 RepID=A0A845BM90_9NEIS|nr:Maf family nucleotide pyrophosphatase [Craterilacuibacter sinensis]MXR35571.1 septum formation protein Maf [Craterilacuibacter sinensis]